MIGGAQAARAASAAHALVLPAISSLGVLIVGRRHLYRKLPGYAAQSVIGSSKPFSMSSLEALSLSFAGAGPHSEGALTRVNEAGQALGGATGRGARRTTFLEVRAGPEVRAGIRAAPAIAIGARGPA